MRYGLPHLVLLLQEGHLVGVLDYMHDLFIAEKSLCLLKRDDALAQSVPRDGQHLRQPQLCFLVD